MFLSLMDLKTKFRQTNCCIFEKKLKQWAKKKETHLNQSTGDCREAVHEVCNLVVKNNQSPIITKVLHNFRRQKKTRIHSK